MKRVALLLMFAGGCNHRRATSADCEAILDRIVALELRERGFRDSALVERKTAELRRTLAPELAQCQGRRIGEHAIECVRAADSTEQVTHVCLR